jgi:hypothetical protein
MILWMPFLQDRHLLSTDFAEDLDAVWREEAMNYRQESFLQQATVYASMGGLLDGHSAQT